MSRRLDSLELAAPGDHPRPPASAKPADPLAARFPLIAYQHTAKKAGVIAQLFALVTGVVTRTAVLIHLAFAKVVKAAKLPASPHTHHTG